MYKVTKVIDFCYGHRLRNYEGKCKFLHGHNGRVEIDLTSDQLDERGMVLDFNDVKREIKGWLDDALDHKMLLREDDPFIETLKTAGEPYYVMKENPTAEAIAKLIFEHAERAKLPVAEVRLWETQSSFATYRKK